MGTAIGFVGIGAMGSAIAGRLVEVYDLYINDKNLAAGEGLKERGATWAEIDEIAATCRFVFLCLPRPTDVHDLLLGSGRLAQVLQQGSVIIDVTTGTPSMGRELRDELRARGVEYCDSPIGGGVRRAAEGTAALMVGASDEVFEQVADLLSTVTPDVLHLGPVGAGHTAKLVNNLLNTCNRFAAMETIRLGEAGGVRRDVLLDVINPRQCPELRDRVHLSATPVGGNPRGAVQAAGVQPAAVAEGCAVGQRAGRVSRFRYADRALGAAVRGAIGATIRSGCGPESDDGRVLRGCR